MSVAKIDEIVGRHRDKRSELIAILQDLQREFKYLPEDAIGRVAERLQMPLIDVYSVATFYRSFSLTPRGKHVCTVCIGTACHVRGAPRILEDIERSLGIKAGQTTADGELTLGSVACLGACALGPIVVMDGDYHEHVNIAKNRKIFQQYGLGYLFEKEGSHEA
jgi:NADH-quinone oxidoreductase subunit E